MTQTRFAHIEVDDGVYAPQSDSWLLCEALDHADLVTDKRVLDICTGSGILAIEAALKGAREVLAFDISPAAVACATRNAERAGVRVDARVGTLADARRAGPYDVVVSNPPYVPSDKPLRGTGPNRAWDAGANGRGVLDELCDLAPDLVAPGADHRAARAGRVRGPSGRQPGRGVRPRHARVRRATRGGGPARARAAGGGTGGGPCRSQVSAGRGSSA